MPRDKKRKKTYLDFISYISIVFTIMIIPLAYILPKTISWENGFLENLQVVVLLTGCLVAFTFYKRTYYHRIHYMWLTVSGVFLLLMCRELSWGRVFFQIKMTEEGPKFILMSQVPYHMFINAFLGIFIVMLIIGAIKTIPWRIIIFKVPVPKIPWGLIFLGVVFSIIGDHGWIFAGYQGETIEELAELLFYFWAIMLTIYYYHCLNKV